MKSPSLWRLASVRRGTPIRTLSLTTVALVASACASHQSSSVVQSGTGPATTIEQMRQGAPAPIDIVSGTAPSPDPRVGLKGGWFNAGEASWNIRLVKNQEPSKDFFSPTTPDAQNLTNSDLAFTGNYVIQGNYDGYQVWDIADPRHPSLASDYVCRGSQSDVSVYRNILFESSEATNGRVDCGLNGVPEEVSAQRARGIRLYDISDIRHPKIITIVQTCRGSHTHTVVTSPNDPDNVYIFVSGSSAVRSEKELAGCSGLMPSEDPNSELFRIEVIQVPLAHPEQAHVVSKPAILADLGPVTKHAEIAADSIAAAQRRAQAAARAGGAGRRGGGGGRPANMGPVQCHDITVYPAIGRAGGACGGYGVLLDISNPAQPRRIGAVADSNFSFWHSATFNNDGTKVLFTDEWGGGSAPRCRVTDKPEWGADAIFTLQGDQMAFKSYYKLPAPQTSEENCVAHNGSLIPIPGRDVMVQGWYQGGISVFDWTDPSHPMEIAYFDRGPLDPTKLVLAGSWSAYWYNGYIYSSEIKRGLDIFDLKASPLVSQNEIDAAKTVRFAQLNVQDQPKFVWPPSFALARAYLDQLERNSGYASDKISTTRSELARAERASGQERKDLLSGLATRLHGDAPSASDQPKVHKLAYAVGDLAKM